MEGIEKITAKIAQDAQDEERRVREEARAQAQAILDQARTQAEQERDAILARGRRAADERLERLSSAAGMERRKLELAARQEVLGEAFDLALEKLCALPEEEYVALLTQLVLKASSTGREQLIFSPRDRSRIGKQALAGAGMLTLSQETRDIRGGFVLVDGDVEVNCAFETMLALEREKLERQAAEMLFEIGDRR